MSGGEALSTVWSSGVMWFVELNAEWNVSLHVSAFVLPMHKHDGIIKGFGGDCGCMLAAYTHDNMLMCMSVI